MHAAIVRALRDRHVVQDALFDQVFPSGQRFRSWLHWTPVDVALRAVALLAPGPRHNVLDVGSGVGKLCLIGAATTSATWFGIEQHAEMVQVASATAVRMNVADRVRFVQGDLTALDWSAFDAFYLFNPFGEILHEATDDALERRDRYVACVEVVQRELARTAVGTRVVTYHGFGGELPPGFGLLHKEPARDDELCLWIKREIT